MKIVSEGTEHGTHAFVALASDDKNIIAVEGSYKTKVTDIGIIH